MAINITNRINEQIRVSEVRVKSEHDEDLGVMPTKEALAKAVDMEVDLIEIVPSAVPPVCKLIDVGKFRYQLEKKEQEQKKKVVHIDTKELRFSVNTQEHDIDTKCRQAREFLKKKQLVRIVVLFAGREITHKDLGYEQLALIMNKLEDVSQVVIPAKLEGKNLSCTIRGK